MYFPCEGKQLAPLFKIFDNFSASAKASYIHVMEQPSTLLLVSCRVYLKRVVSKPVFAFFIPDGVVLFSVLFSEL